MEIGSSNFEYRPVDTDFGTMVSVSCWRLVLLTVTFNTMNTKRKVSVSCWRLVLLTRMVELIKDVVSVSVSCWRLVLLTETTESI